MKVLIVDDSPISRRILTGIIQQHCEIQDVTTSNDGAGAIERIKAGSFDLVLLDWQLPEKTGIEVLEEIRALGLKTPVIMVTAGKEKDQVLRAFKAGANDYLMKPFDPKPGAKRILQVLEKVKHAARRPDLRKALVADDSPVLRKILVNTLKRDCGFTEVAEVSDGKAAVEAVQAADFDLVLLDWNMPSMTGIEALRAIRAAHKLVPVVMVTSEKEGARIVEAIDAGANSYIIKPFEPHTLGEKIRQILHVHA